MLLILLLLLLLSIEYVCLRAVTVTDGDARALSSVRWVTVHSARVKMNVS